MGMNEAGCYQESECCNRELSVQRGSLSLLPYLAVYGSLHTSKGPLWRAGRARDAFSQEEGSLVSAADVHFLVGGVPVFRHVQCSSKDSEDGVCGLHRCSIGSAIKFSSANPWFCATDLGDSTVFQGLWLVRVPRDGRSRVTAATAPH